VTIDQFHLVLVAASLLLIVGVVAVRLSTRVGLPILLLYLGIGMAIGEAGLGLRFDDAQLTQVVGLGLLAIILAEGGLTTRWEVIRPVLAPSLLLATVGVTISVAVTAGAAYWLLGTDLRTALLLGAVVSSTDAAAVFAVLRRLPVGRRVASTLEAESGFNDAPVVILVALLVADGWEQTNAWQAGGQMLYQLVAGAAIGLAVAWLGSVVIRRVALPAIGLYPLATIAVAVLAFGVAGTAGASSFMAVYLAALLLGNSSLPHQTATRGFAEALAWLAQISLFVLLGLLASPGRLVDALVPALVVGGVLLLVARPLSVVLTTAPFRVPWREQVFLSWAGLRGAVPIVLATIPVSAGIPAAERVFDVVLVLVAVFTLVQAPPLPWLARRLGVDRAPPPDTRRLGAHMMEYWVPDWMPGERVDELPLPEGVVVAAIVREDRTFVPAGHAEVRPGDGIVLVVPRQQRRRVERLLGEWTASGTTSIADPDLPVEGPPGGHDPDDVPEVSRRGPG
jgi:potassium/hydrogen antiporter